MKPTGIMILPSSHSPNEQEHAMEAALREPQRGGETPMELCS